MLKNILNHINFKFQKVDLWAIFAVILCLGYAYLFNLQEIYENSTIENLQLIPLIIAFILCLKAKSYKVFFNFIAAIILLMFFRELSYGRVIFCQMPDNPHDFYPWSHYKYGFFADIIIGIYLALTVVLSLANNIVSDIIEIIKKVAFPFWTFLIAFASIIAQLFGEKVSHNTIFEEAAELCMYFIILSLVVIYNKQLSK